MPPYLDVDSDDSFLGLAEPRYQGRTAEDDQRALELLREGGVELPGLPPITDDGP